MLAASVGYAGWGIAVHGLVSESMVGDDGKTPTTCGLVLSFCVIANLVVTYPLLHSSVATAAEAARGGQYLLWVRLALVASSVVVYLLLPHFFLMITLVASVFVPLLGIFLPLGMF